MILRLKPNGLQYSASRHTIAIEEIIIFIRFIFFLSNLSKTPSKPVIPKATKSNPNQNP